MLLAPLLALLSLAALPALAAPPAAPVASADKEGEVRFLYPAGQVYDYDKVFPLVVEIANRGPLPKSYRVNWPLRSEIPSGLASLKLEPGEARRFSLVFPRNEASGLSSLEVNKVTYPPELQQNPRTSITGLLSPPDEKFDYLRTLKLEVDPNAPVDPNTGAKTKLVPLAALSILDPELVPESWPLLSSLDVLIVYDMPSMALSKGQKNALLDWACQGGQLVLVSDGVPEEFRGTPFEQHLPLKPTGVLTSAGLLQLIGQPAPGAQTLMSYQGHPLLMRKPIMRGNVFLVTAPLKDLAPLTTEQAEKLWRLVQPPGSDGSRQQYSYGYNGFNAITSNTLQNIPELPRAGGGWVALFLLVYALIVGPVNLGILRRKDKMLWSFLTVPAIALLFAGGAYLLNLANRSSIPVMRELGLLEVRSGDLRGYGTSEALLFSPSARRYLIDCSPQGVCHAANYSYDEKPFGMYDILPDGGLQANIEMGTWDIFMMGTESLITLPAPITGSYKNGSLTVDTPFSTEPDGAILYISDQQRSKPFGLKQGKQSLPLEKLDQANTYDRFGGLGARADKKKHPGREALLSALSQQGAGMFKTGKPYLLFWTDRLKAPMTPRGSAVHKGEYLVVVELAQ
jgi:hypothetical protein